ncbi:MAG TPA: ATP-binding cassette domain-containing protein, partial [Oculatellaceae cyanobacterium]
LSLLMTIAPTTLLQSGTIRYKGVDLRKMSPLEYRKKIAVVFQESFILNGSILENIAFGAGIPITEDDARQAAMLAGCSFLDDTAILPQGLHTHIGATGKSLSGGQQQRICIARALCKRPEILLLE